MSPYRLIIASLRYHWRTNLAVACGVAVGTAILTGALLVGDSMRGSLRELTLERLGRINQALVSDHFVRAALADDVAGEQFAAPVILLRISMESVPPASIRAPHVALIGCDERFWHMGTGGPKALPRSREIVLNRPLAEQLDVRRGDTVLLRLPHLGAVPADSALGRKQETVRTQRVTVSDIIETDGLGRFGLRPTQRVPHNAYVSLEWLQDQLAQPGGANAILVAGGEEANGPQLTAGQLKLTDYGLHIKKTARGYWNITSDRMLLDTRTEQAILKALVLSAVQKGTVPFSSNENRDSPHAQLALTYLANTLACHDRTIPYSTVTAIDFSESPPLGPFLSTEGKPLPPLGSGEIALNAWAADELHAKLGDAIRVSYFEPESVEGQVREATATLRLAAIVRLSDAADDRALTPTVKGLTDEQTMADWDPPFPFDAKRIRPADEKYWDRYGPTPKAFVSLATGRRLWGSRFGRTTSIRLAQQPRQLAERLDPAAMGLVFQPVRRQGLEAAARTTPFGVLFLCFSFFIIVAAAMLVALLFRLGVEQRAAQLGTLLAVGLARRQVGRLLLGEGLAVAAAGSLLGVPLGIGYAGLLLVGLRTWWLPAIGTPLVRFHFTAASLSIGAASGLLIAMAVIWLSVRRLGRLPLRWLLAGQTAVDRPSHVTRKTRRRLQVVLLLLAVGPTTTLLLLQPGEQLQAGAFFLCGATALVALLALLWIRLKAGRTGPAVKVGGGNLWRMAMRNAARNAGRSTLTIGLMAAATFLIVAVSAFRVDRATKRPLRIAATGASRWWLKAISQFSRTSTRGKGERRSGFRPTTRRH